VTAPPCPPPMGAKSTRTGPRLGRGLARRRGRSGDLRAGCGAHRSRRSRRACAAASRSLAREAARGRAAARRGLWLGLTADPCRQPLRSVGRRRHVVRAAGAAGPPAHRGGRPRGGDRRGRPPARAGVEALHARFCAELRGPPRSASTRCSLRAQARRMPCRWTAPTCLPVPRARHALCPKQLAPTQRPRRLVVHVRVLAPGLCVAALRFDRHLPRR
jgi:hypothetical protein